MCRIAKRYFFAISHIACCIGVRSLLGKFGKTNFGLGTEEMLKELTGNFLYNVHEIL